MVLRSPGGWGLSLALVFVYLVQGVDPAPLDDWAHDDTQLSFPTEGKNRDMKHHVAVQSARERYISRREKIRKKLLRISSRRLMYRSRAL